jgi:hypothetical protein
LDLPENAIWTKRPVRVVAANCAGLQHSGGRLEIKVAEQWLAA